MRVVVRTVVAELVGIEKILAHIFPAVGIKRVFRYAIAH